MVFRYYRWFGWLDESRPIAGKLGVAGELQERFDARPDSFSLDELRKAVPSWTAEEVELSRPWLCSLQREPLLWLRAKRATAERVAMELGDCAPLAAMPEA